MKTETARAALRKPQTLHVTSPAFQPGQAIPRVHSCHGDDVSPELAIAGVPQGAAALALVVDDPDAPRGTWTHWTAWDLPAGTAALAEGKPAPGVEGTTSSGEVGYHGPCPPSGTHRYFFRVFALDRKLGLPPGASVEDVWAALDKHVLAWGELMGTFTRP